MPSTPRALAARSNWPGCAPARDWYNGTNQIGLITKTLNLIGGYTVTNWAASYPITQPTILDAQYGGRALQITGVPVSVSA